MTGRRLRVLLLYWGRRGAGQRYSYDLATHWTTDPEIDLHTSLSRQGELFAEVTALGLPGLAVTTFETRLGCGVRSLGLPALRHRTHRYVRDRGIDIVFCPMTHVWNAAVLPGLPAPFVTMAHDPEPLNGDSPLVRRRLEHGELKRATRVIALSDVVRTQLVNGIGIDPRRIRRLAFTALPRIEGGRPRPPRTGPVRVLFIGRIKPYKGLDLLLQATRHLRDRGLAFTLRIAGSGDWRPYRASIAALGGVEVVDRWLLEREVDDEIGRTDIVVLPYRAATQSGVISVAATYAARIVATPVGGLAEQLAAIPDSLVAADPSAAALADSLATAIAQAPDRRARQDQGLDAGQAHDDAASVFARHADALKAILAEAASAV